MNHTVFDNLVQEWLGIPHKHGGRDRKGVDCGFFCACFFNDYFERVGSEKRVVVPPDLLKRYDRHYFHRSTSLENSILKQFCDSQPFFYPVSLDTPLEKGHLVIFPQGHSPGSHIGIMVGKMKFIHSIIKIGVSFENTGTRHYSYIYRVDY